MLRCEWYKKWATVVSPGGKSKKFQCDLCHDRMRGSQELVVHLTGVRHAKGGARRTKCAVPADTERKEVLKAYLAANGSRFWDPATEASKHT